MCPRRQPRGLFTAKKKQSVLKNAPTTKRIQHFTVHLVEPSQILYLMQSQQML